MNSFLTLDDVCEFIVDCLHATAPIQDEGYPLIRTPNIGAGRLILDGVQRVSKKTYKEWTRRAVPKKDDLILAREAPAGNIAVVREGQNVCLGQRTVHLRPNKAFVDPNFICYFILAPRQRANLLATETGVTAKHVNMKDIRRLRLPGLPGLAEQKRKGEIIAAYDDLIENNRRRRELLEQSARLLYKEWFVDLHFPGHENTKITNGIPDGWQKQTAFDVMEVLSGGTPKTKNSEFWDGEIPFFTPKDATNCAYVMNTEKFVSEEGVRSCNSKLYPKNTVFITARGTVGKINLAQTPMAMNQSCYALVAIPPVNQYFLYFSLVNGVEQFRSRAVGAVFDAIIRDTFKLIPFLVPTFEQIDAFSEVAKSILGQIDILSTSIAKLKEAKDHLLPKLMNGEIEL